jgi:chorismate mutase-like protein
MADNETSLDALRREIDRIDDAIHDLLMRRTQTVVSVGATKRATGEPNLRPAREAQVLRRLVARHAGPFPKAALVRLWRELVAGQLRVQGRFSVAAFAPVGQGQLWDLARDHFGSTTPAKRHETARSVLRAVTDGEATVGVLPMPGEDESEPWWPALAGPEPGTPRIAARLPFVGARQGPEALAVAALDQEPSGADRSYLIFEADPGASRRAIADALAAAALEPVFLARREALCLAEIATFVAANDRRLATIGPPVVNPFAVGGYAVPLGDLRD